MAMQRRYAIRILAAGALLSVLGSAHAQSAQTLGTIEQLFGMGTSLLNQGTSSSSSGRSCASRMPSGSKPARHQAISYAQRASA